MKLPRKRFGAILIDPPWKFRTWSAKGRDRCPDKHYRLMSLEKIRLLPIEKLAKPDCVLFMWTTWPFLIEALALIPGWGFTYKTVAFVWMKTNHTGTSRLITRDEPLFPGSELFVGTGYWTRANTEVCLLATRGKPKRKHRDVAQAILEERREHSRKPDCVRARIERLVAGPYLELFARSKRNGWTARGDQTNKFKEVQRERNEGPIRRSVLRATQATKQRSRSRS